MFILGCDPGFSGGLSLFENGKCLEAFLMPIYESTNGKRNIDGTTIANYIRSKKVEAIIIEDVHSMPKQGISSAWQFGKGFGIILGVCMALNIKIIQISPMKWKKLVLGNDYDHVEKTGAMNFCKATFPEISLLATKRCKIPHDGICDSIAIGYSYYVLESLNHEGENNINTVISGEIK